MKNLLKYFYEQLPKIANCLQQEINSLSPLVKPVAQHILNAGGKRLRPVLCILTAQAFGCREDNVYPLAGALELIHSATLLHDDVLDNAIMRRSQKAAHLIFGLKETILAGDALLARANQVVTTYHDTSLISCVSEAIYQTAAGEILEIERMKQETLSFNEYLEIIMGKTGYLIQTCSQSGAILAKTGGPCQEAARIFGRNLGIAFQLVDDALDYTVDHDSTGKPLGGDLREGKLTLPLIMFLQTQDRKRQQDLLDKIKERRLTEEEHLWIVDQVKNNELVSSTRQVAQKYLDLARHSLEQFPSSSEKDLLNQVLEYIQTRDN